jgi:hypothetical protein
MTDRTKKTAVLTKRVGEHAPDCYAVKNVQNGSWDTVWWFNGDVEYRDSLGRNGRFRNRRFVVARCNCTGCSAQLLVRENDLLLALPRS